MIDGDYSYHSEHSVMCGMESQCCKPEIKVILYISYTPIRERN